MTKRLLVSMFCCLLSACASTYNPSYYYNEVLIINNSRQLIQDVSVVASESGRIFGCGNIAPYGICSNKFPRRRYMNSPIQVTWIFGNMARQTRELLLEVPATMTTAYPLRGVLEISPKGSISAYFQQAEPAN